MSATFSVFTLVGSQEFLVVVDIILKHVITTWSASMDNDPKVEKMCQHLSDTFISPYPKIDNVMLKLANLHNS